MSSSQFFTIYVGVLLTMLASRCLPMFILKGRELPDSLTEVLNLIPPAAFAALVANDLFSPAAFLSASVLEIVIPFVAAGLVALVAAKTRSLMWSAVAGVLVYAALSLLV